MERQYAFWALEILVRLVRMMKGFDVKVLVYDSYFPDQDDEKYGVTFVKDKEELFRESDILSLHVPFNEETKGMIDKNVFAMMKPTAYLINTCRGGVINEEDLIQALKEGQIQGAGLDVLVQEPPEKDNPLLSMDNVSITSHMGDGHSQIQALFTGNYRRLHCRLFCRKCTIQ